MSNFEQDRKEDSTLYPDEAGDSATDNHEQSNSYYYTSATLLNENHNPNGSEISPIPYYPEGDSTKSVGAESGYYYSSTDSNNTTDSFKSQEKKVQPMVGEFANVKRGENEPEIIFWNGKACYKHQIKDSDNLMYLSLKYKTTVQKIMKANNMLNDDLDFFQEKYLIIPVSGAKINRNDIADASLHEREREKALIGLFMDARAKEIESNSDVARYYLSVNSWDLKKAVIELDEDLAWENKNGKKKNKFLALLKLADKRLKKALKGKDKEGKPSTPTK